jgi:hypothetical protein
MVICLGGLAGAGALVCCDLDDGLDQIETAPDGETADEAEPAEPEEIKAEPNSVH